MSWMDNWKQRVEQVLFPDVCFVCGNSLTEPEHSVCGLCALESFQDANPEGGSFPGEIIAPEGVLFQHALWLFDKGGYLQDLLHMLKYQHQYGIGIDLGRHLGKSLLSYPPITSLDTSHAPPLLIPVPLHPKKQKRRGYNQARAIAEGVAAVTGWPVADPKTVLRIRNTSTQTGFSLEKRNKNVAQAFLVGRPGKLSDRAGIIVDDVFTTGSTSFELVKTVQQHGITELGIATIAQA
ncbi:MAG: ComF family protein [Bacteroidota bacterium]